MQLCFVAAGTTGFCQPLDIAAMRPFKLKLRQLTSQQLSLQILSAEGLDMKTELNKVILRQSVMNWVSAALMDLREDEGLVRRAWAHLQCESEDDYQETVRLGREDHEQGLLFPAHRGMVPEEAPAAPAPAAAAAEEEQLWQDDEDGEVLDVHDEVADDEAEVDSLHVEAVVDSPPVEAEVDSPLVEAEVDSLPVEAEVDSPPVEAAVGSPPAPAAPVPVVHAPEQKVISKFLALQLVYGKGPPKK